MRKIKGIFKNVLQQWFFLMKTYSVQWQTSQGEEPIFQQEDFKTKK